MPVFLIIAIVVLILCFVSKTMDIIVGLLGTIGSVILFAWLNSTDSVLTQFQLAWEYGVNPSDLKTFSIVAIVVSVIILVIGIARGKKVQQVVVVQQQAPAPASEPANKETEKAEKKVEDKKE